MKSRLAKFYFVVSLLCTVWACDVSEASEKISGRDYKREQRNGMHSCPLGQFVTGVHVDKNLLLCSDSFGSYSLGDERTQLGNHNNSNTQSHGMHACPEGKAMTGLHVGRNELACAQVSGAPIPRVVDANTQRPNIDMHACPEGKPQSGIHVDMNLALCGTQYTLRIHRFTVEPNTGDRVKLQWLVDCTAPDCNIRLRGKNLHRDRLPPSGSEHVMPEEDTLYILTAESESGRAHELKELWVQVPAKVQYQCGFSCPAGYHPEEFSYSGTCGGDSRYKNQTRCVENRGPSFYTCGHTCPEGYHPEGGSFNDLCSRGTSFPPPVSSNQTLCLH